MIGVILEHWASFVPHQSTSAPLQGFAAATHLGGLLVHQFFLLSGFGLALSYFTKGVSSWPGWGARRLAKIIVPYWVIVAMTFVALNGLHQMAPARHPESFSGSTLVAYLTLMRNFVPSSWAMNSSLWFMPVIVGLYLSFPFLVKILDRRGPVRFMVFSVVLTIGTAVAFFCCGYPLTHQASIFIFHIAPFATGCTLAYAVCRLSFDIEILSRLPFVFIGAVCIGLSALLVKTFEWGGAANDLLTVVGLFLVAFFFLSVLRRLKLARCVGFLNLFGRHSYVVYLIHLPLIQFVWKPLLLSGEGVAASHHLLIAEFVSVPLFLLLAMAIHRPLVALSGAVERRLRCLVERPDRG